MTDYLETTVDKFTFRVAKDRCYSSEGVWAKADGTRIRIGLSDFLQQRSGDVAFAEARPVGTSVKVGDEVAVIETIKVNISLASPVEGTVAEENPVMHSAPETVNQDPYGTGWVADIDATNWEADRAQMLSPERYLTLMRGLAEEEAKNV